MPKTRGRSAPSSVGGAKASPVRSSGAAVGDHLDRELVDEAVVWIRARIVATLSRGLVEIGDWLFAHFFGGDVERFRSRSPSKNASFNSLLERSETVELPVKRSALYNAVATAAMRHAVGGAKRAYAQLPPSHQVELLPLQEPAKVEATAQRALEQAYPVRKLRDLVARERARTTRRRRGRPIVLKMLGQAEKVLAFEEGKRGFTKADVAELPPDKAEWAISTTMTLVARLQELLAKLEARET